ncbi:MAG: hypothetical protein CMN78_04550 [Spirochaetales bacterium]|nr:hypothetical protein [Spirochaetales bacterium]
MGGFFGLVSQANCVGTLFFGTDYPSHLGTKRGGLAVCDGSSIRTVIHDITNSQFRSKFERDITHLKGTAGIGVISDYEDQPLIMGSHLDLYAIATVSVIQNIDDLTKKASAGRATHFSGIYAARDLYGRTRVRNTFERLYSYGDREIHRRYQRLDDMLNAIGIPHEKVCTYCWSENSTALS